MSPGQRVAWKELRNLPITHNAACRFADKSGVTVVTPLVSDDENIKKELNNAKLYDRFENDPSETIRKKYQEVGR